MKLTYSYSKSLLLINPNLTKEIFLRKVGAQSGYARQMFSRMYENIFSELISVDREYEKYYSFEYASLAKFLWKKYNIDSEDLEELISIRKDNPDCILYRKDDYSYGDYGIGQFTFSETLYKRITDILLLKNYKYENQI